MLDHVGGRGHLFSALAGFACVVGLAAAVAILSDEPDQLSVPWWRDGQLHIGSTTVPAPMPENLVMVRDGAVYWAEPETGLKPEPMVFVDTSGTVRKVGSKSWPSPIAADPNGSTAAWVEETRETQPRLIVFDTAKREIIVERPLMKRGPRWGVLDAGSFPISIDGDRV